MTGDVDVGMSHFFLYISNETKRVFFYIQQKLHTTKLPPQTQTHAYCKVKYLRHQDENRLKVCLIYIV